MESAARWLATSDAGAILREKHAWLAGSDAHESEESLVRGFVLSHCAGVGAPLEREVARAMMVVRVNVLATGYTGCRPQCAELLIAMLNRDIVPVVPGKGSVGAAGVAQLAHILRVICGYGGEVWRDGKRVGAAEGMGELAPLDLSGKEALSMMNGSSLTTAMAALACARAETLLQTAEAACALSFEVVRADLECLHLPTLEARGHQGAVGVAARLRAQLEGSELVWEGRTPDPFSIRCAPAVLGAARDGLAVVYQVVQRELNGAVDNPLVFEERGLVEAGNFHAAPVAMAMDQLKVALVEVASLAERRIFRMTYGQLSGLPSYLVHGTGTNSGLMLAQYTAASLVSECKVWSHPASVDTIPTVQHQEDHVSMGPIAARGALHISEALADVLAIELLCAAQGLEFHLSGQAVSDEGVPLAVEPLKPGVGTSATYRAVRERVEKWVEDRVLHPDLVVLGRAVRDGCFADHLAV